MYIQYLKQQYKKGFTFVELLVTVSLFSLLVIVVVASTLALYRSHSSSGNQSTYVRTAQSATEKIVKGLREATLADNGAYPLAHIAPSAITFFSDINGNGRVDRVVYALSDSILSRTVTPPWGSPPTYSGVSVTSIISSQVQNLNRSVPLFRYFDAEGNEVFDAGDVVRVRRVVVTLIVNAQGARPESDVILTSSAALRNLRNE